MSLDILEIRRDFPILSRQVHGKPLVYFDNAATTQKPKALIAALSSFYENHNGNIHRGAHTLSDEATTLVENARQKTADFINAPKPETIVFTRNATEAINLVAHSWGRKFLKAGDEIVLTELEHHSNLVPWQILAAEKSLKLRFIPINRVGDLDLSAAEELFSDKTKLVSFTAASNVLGTLPPVLKIIGLAKKFGAKTLVDASQWTPHFKTDVQDWDCDFLAFSAHKMLGPTGLGVLYGREKLLEEMDPFLGGGDMIETVELETFTPNVLPAKFEAGTPAIAEAAVFPEALNYLSKIGFSAIEAQEKILLRRALEILKNEPEIELYGSALPEGRGGVISFNLKGLHPHDVGTALDLEGVAVRTGHHCCQPLMRRLEVGGTARASFYFYNMLEEVEIFGRALRKTIEFFKPRLKAGVR
jgi:cysteine desulfurase/selenocysteine lyase